MGPEMSEINSLTDRASRPAPPKLQVKSKAASSTSQNGAKAGSTNHVAIIAGSQAMDKQSSTLQHDSNGTSTGSRKLTLTNNISSTETTEERLRQHEKSWSAEKAKLTTVIEKYKQQMVQAEETQRNTQIEIENLKMQLESALTSLQGMQNKLAASQEETVAAKKEAEQMDEKCSDLEDEAVRALEKLQKEHTKQLDARDGHIRQLLNQAMAGKAEGRWNPTPDGETRRQLAVLNNEIRSFSKEWAATSLEALESLMKVPVVARYYSRFVRVSQGHLPPSLRKVSPKMLEKLPAVLLNAAVADEVQDSFFGNPFFCISVEAQPAFKKIFIDLVKVSPKEAHQWRCLLWRILCPKGVSLQPGDNEHSSEAENNIKEYIPLVEECFSKCPANLLFKEPLTEAEREVRSEQLQKIFRSAASIAVGLWSQPSHISSLTLPRLWHQNMKFDVSSNLLQGHPLSKVDEDDPEHNGREISVVTRPALLVFDSEEEEIISESKAGSSNGDGYRVLAKAIVLLDEKN